MNEYIEERALAVAGYIIESNATVRQAARQFGISKSTVHKDITGTGKICYTQRKGKSQTNEK